MVFASKCLFFCTLRARVDHCLASKVNLLPSMVVLSLCRFAFSHLSTLGTHARALIMGGYLKETVLNSIYLFVISVHIRFMQP